MNKSKISKDNIILTEEKLEELERLAALSYTIPDMAMYFGLPSDEFQADAENSDSKINYHIRRGILVNTARAQMEVMNNAEKGNTQAIQLLSKIQYRKNFETARRDILYDCEIDEKILHRLEAYIESGSTIKLKPGEELYLEAMTLMNSMRRKYGRSKTIKFFCNAPFNLSYAQARDMYEHSINLFYSDSKVEKKALRNLKAQQLEDAAKMVLDTAKEPSDFEIYGKLIKLSAEILQLNQPDPPEIPKGTYDRPYRVFTLDPKLIGMDRPDRNLLARQIDKIVGATETEKQKAKYDAGIEDIPFEDMLNEYKEEN